MLVPPSAYDGMVKVDVHTVYDNSLHFQYPDSCGGDECQRSISKCSQ